jgi:ribosome-binding factor A
MTRRAERVSNLIRQEISVLLQEQVNDPRLRSLISVTKVSTSDDLKNAKVFVSVLGDNITKNEVLQGFVSASGFLRRELASRVRLRQIPELKFQFDDSIEYGTKILKLIEQVASDSTDDECRRNSHC